MKKIFILLTLFFIIPYVHAQNTHHSCFLDLSPDEFYLNINTQEAFLVDVRLFKDYRKNRIEGALLATNKESLLSLCTNLDPQTPVYLYCEDGDRSRTAAEILCRELNFEKVYNLKGGLRQWTKQYPLDESRIRKENGFNSDRYK
ncbi:MAG: rhodanese-like domain-containing protein [Bacteroidales bacterium]|jgi:rhodanese-related sulfurtransferase|nr:rhodanese-like domain-containing protein [Bacteroidales bacterium]